MAAPLYAKWNGTDNWKDDEVYQGMVENRAEDPEGAIWATSMMRKQWVEVNFKKLTGPEQTDLKKAMTKDIDDWCKYDALKVIKKDEIPTDAQNIVELRWVLRRRSSVGGRSWSRAPGPVSPIARGGSWRGRA